MELNELNIYKRKNYYASLALENYEDNTGCNNKIIEDAWDLLSQYRKTKDSLSITERIEFTKKISEKFDLVIDEIGKEKFVFYDDGVINYIWKSGK